jgi:hypothetical protein
MVDHPSFDSPTFKLVAKELVALHLLIKVGQDDSPEGESIRDALDTDLKALTRREKERAQWLSEDLYSVSEPPPPTALKEMNPLAEQQLNQAIEARQNREWDRSLAMLRLCRESIAPALLSFLRGTIWLQAGIPDVAAHFFAHASESDPANTNYQAAYTLALEQSGLAKSECR